MPLKSLDLLDKYKANPDDPFPPGYPANTRIFFSPVDDLHGVLKDLLASATTSLITAMYGYDDKDLDDIIRAKLASENIFVSMSFDKTEARVGLEPDLLAHWHNDGYGNSIAVGKSIKGAIMHLKVIVIDGVDVITGSTNWSSSGESRQDNQLIVIRDPLVAAETRSRLDLIHDDMLKQMARAALAAASKQTKRTRSQKPSSATAPAKPPRRRTSAQSKAG